MLILNQQMKQNKKVKLSPKRGISHIRGSIVQLFKYKIGTPKGNVLNNIVHNI